METPIDLEVEECILKCKDSKGKKIEVIMDKEKFEDWVIKLQSMLY